MIAGWFELTGPELAFLADVEIDRVNLLDQVTVAGQWLRDPEVRERGMDLFARRIDLMEEVDAHGWALVMTAAELFGKARRGASLILRGDTVERCLLVAEATQLAVMPDGVAIRVVEGPMSPEDLEAELLEAGTISSGASVRWWGGNTLEMLAWDGQNLVVPPGQEIPTGPIGLRGLCDFALQPARDSGPSDATGGSRIR